MKNESWWYGMEGRKGRVGEETIQYVHNGRSANIGLINKASKWSMERYIACSGNSNDASVVVAGIFGCKSFDDGRYLFERILGFKEGAAI